MKSLTDIVNEENKVVEKPLNEAKNSLSEYIRTDFSDDTVDFYEIEQDMERLNDAMIDMYNEVVDEDDEVYDADDIEFKNKDFRKKYKKEIADYLEFKEDVYDLLVDNEESLINSNYAVEYAEESYEDLGYPELPSWLVVDWERTWEANLRHDYSMLTYDGNDLYYRY